MSGGGRSARFNSSLGGWIVGEVRAALKEVQTYEDWLVGNKSMRERLSGTAHSKLRDVLPKIGDNRLREGTATWDSGARLGNSIQVAIITKGVIPQSARPYVAGQFASKPPDLRGTDFYKIKRVRPLKTLPEVIAALQSNGPAVAGITMYQSGMSGDVTKTGVLPMPVKSEQVMGGHAICIVGYDDDRKLLKFINDWGPDWEDHGYGYLPFAYFEAESSEAWAISM